MLVGIIGAMDVEVANLHAALAGATVRRVAGMEFAQGTLHGCPAVVVRSGIGKVNAALCTQVLASVFGVTHVVNTGAAGSLDARLRILDVVVSTDCVQHDVDVANLGYALGQVPQMDALAFEADAHLRGLACQAVAQAVPEAACFEGRVASGDQFVRTQERKSFVLREFRALCCEMEGAAIAQACHANGIPFVVMRAISDAADGTDAMRYDLFEARAAVRSARIVEHLCRLLAGRPGASDAR